MTAEQIIAGVILLLLVCAGGSQISKPQYQIEEVDPQIDEYRVIETKTGETVVRGSRLYCEKWIDENTK